MEMTEADPLACRFWFCETVVVTREVLVATVIEEVVAVTLRVVCGSGIKTGTPERALV